jgi:hypothetical protein
MNTKFLGLHICNHLRWKDNTESIVLKSCTARYGAASLFRTGSTDSLETIYFACLHTIVKTCYKFGRNLSKSKKKSTYSRNENR